MNANVDHYRKRLRDVIARQCAYNGHTYQDGLPPDDAHMSSLYGADWVSVFDDDAARIIAAIEAAGFTIVASGRLAALERLARDAEATVSAGNPPPHITLEEVAALLDVVAALRPAAGPRP